MYTGSILVLALSAASMVSAHGKVAQVTGSSGGNTTALGIKGASVATFGPNAATESDTTVYNGNANNPMQDGLGKTTSSGNLKVAQLSAAMALSGSTLPQVAADGTGVLNGKWQIVTSDGTANNKQGDLFAVLDSTATGAYSKGVKLTATSNMVGNGQGNVVQRAVTRALRMMGKRATNVGATANFQIKIPAGTKCTGTIDGVSNVCLMKVANNNAAGPFGGNVGFQIAGAGGAAAAPAGNTTAAPAAAADTKAATKAAKANRFRRSLAFEA